MVNTFITHKPTPTTGFSQTALNLDLLRLRKQIVEASQILRILEDVPLIALHFGWKCPEPVPETETGSSFLNRIEQFKSIVNRYLKGKTRIKINIDGTMSTIESFNKEDHFVATDDNCDFVQIDMHTVRVFSRNSSRDYPLSKVVYFGERIITLGFARHPIVHMWIGYEDSLRRYICDLQIELRTRPKKDGTMSESKIRVLDPGYNNVRYPWWTLSANSYCWISHRASLYVKEMSRNESPWYRERADFNCKNTKIWCAKTSVIDNKKREKGLGYVWFGKLTFEQIDSLLRGDILPPETIACPQTDSINRPSKKI